MNHAVSIRTKSYCRKETARCRSCSFQFADNILLCVAKWITSKRFSIWLRSRFSSVRCYCARNYKSVSADWNATGALFSLNRTRCDTRYRVNCIVPVQKRHFPGDQLDSRWLRHDRVQTTSTTFSRSSYRVLVPDSLAAFINQRWAISRTRPTGVDSVCHRGRTTIQHQSTTRTHSQARS